MVDDLGLHIEHAFNLSDSPAHQRVHGLHGDADRAVPGILDGDAALVLPLFTPEGQDHQMKGPDDQNQRRRVEHDLGPEAVRQMIRHRIDDVIHEVEPNAHHVQAAEHQQRAAQKSIQRQENAIDYSHLHRSFPLTAPSQSFLRFLPLLPRPARVRRPGPERTRRRPLPLLRPPQRKKKLQPPEPARR